MAGTNTSLWRYDGTYGVNSRGERVLAPTPDSAMAAEADRRARNAASMARHNRLVNYGRLASILPFGVAAGSALAGGGAAAGAGAGGAGGAGSAAAHGYSSPGIFGGLFGGGATAPTATAAGATAGSVGTVARLGSILSSPGAEMGVNAGLSIYGQRSQNKANQQARADMLAAQQKALELEERRLALEAQNANLDREDARALNAAIQDLEKKKFALAQEQAQFERSIIEQDRSVRDAYRTNYQEPAARRLSSILGL